MDDSKLPSQFSGSIIKGLSTKPISQICNFLFKKTDKKLPFHTTENINCVSHTQQVNIKIVQFQNQRITSLKSYMLY